MRYFVNNLPNLSIDLNKSCTFLKPKILAYIENILKNFFPTVNNCDGGIYVGISGVAYTLFKLLTSKDISLSENENYTITQSMKDYINIALMNLESDSNKSVAFYLGNAGVNLVGYMVYNYFKSNSNAEDSVASNCLKNLLEAHEDAAHLNLKCGSDELFVGRSGYISGLYFLQKIYGIEIIKNDIKPIITNILTSGQKLAHKQNFYGLLYSYYGTYYIGAAHGISAILLQLLNFYDILKTIPAGVEDVKATIDFLLSKLWKDGNFAPTIDEIGHGPPDANNELVHWCHGAPGVIYLLAKAYLVFKEDKYLEGARKCGECIWEKGLLKKGPGLCHGIAGNAYAFLLLYRLSNLKEEIWLQRAHQFAHFLFSNEFINNSRTPDSPYSLYEGTAGTVCFLLDLLRPEEAEFPFFHVFD